VRRRRFLASALLAPVACATTGVRVTASSSFEEGCAQIERELGARLGVVILDTGRGRRAAWRADERFPLCSTFKTLLAAAVLARVDAGQCALGDSIRFGREALLAYAPVVQQELARAEMTIGALCSAAVTVSDNAAANLLLARLGGPSAVTAYVRTLGDGVTRLDRVEPALNDVAPGDPRDTTSPSAMAETVRRLFLGDALSPASREHLVAWHRATTTGAARLRAGLPAAWALAHKTGTGADATNDVGVAWPPGAGPVVIAAYDLDGRSPLADREAALARVGRLAAAFARALPGA
jgi:beta-lactamase class A